MTSRTGQEQDNVVQQAKIVLLGEQGVGKSCIAVRFAGGEFLERSEATIGAMFLTQTVAFDTYRIKFDIWDTAGQERYRTLAPMYYRNAQAAIIVYDITRPDSFLKAMTWVDELKQQTATDIFMVLAGNKSDLTNRVVLAADAEQVATEHGLEFYETSALTGDGIQNIFTAIAKDLAVKRRGKNENDSKKLKITKCDANKTGCRC